MPRPVLVVGLLGRSPHTEWETVLSGRTIVARSRTITERITPPGWTIEHCYDDDFERRPLDEIAASVAQDIAQRAASDDITYLVPGPGWAGDATVAALAEITTVEVAASAPARSVAAQTQVIDALLLAMARAAAPFDTGAYPVDPTVPSLVLNWHGERVAELASERLRLIYGITELPQADQSGTIFIPARDPLDSPPSFPALAYITARLRQPDGCPWDREQTHESLLADFASEVEEYAAAVRAEDWDNAAEELGDVLLNVLMQAQIAVESGHFRVEDVLTRINAKLVRRHPHVFGGVTASSPEDVLAVWNSVKQQEKDERSSPSK